MKHGPRPNPYPRLRTKSVPGTGTSRVRVLSSHHPYVGYLFRVPSLVTDLARDIPLILKWSSFSLTFRSSVSLLIDVSVSTLTTPDRPPRLQSFTPPSRRLERVSLELPVRLRKSEVGLPPPPGPSEDPSPYYIRPRTEVFREGPVSDPTFDLSSNPTSTPGHLLSHVKRDS